MPYRRARWLPNRHLMTMYANVVRLPVRVPTTRERWELPDGDFLDLDRLDAAPDAPRVLVLHGLEGSSQARYVRGLMAQLHARGLGAIALNFRGCSGELNRLPRMYHSGETGDVAYVLQRLVAERPGVPIGLAGFSLGGNVTAKLLGERGDDLPSELRAAAIVSVPYDLHACAIALDGPGVAAKLYRGRFLARLKPKAIAKARRFPGTLDERAIRAATTLIGFDDVATAPLHGFSSARDYYARSSSAPLLPNVRRPLLMVIAKDDPFVPESSLPLAVDNPALELDVSEEGGHVGFIEGTPWAPRYYDERRVAAYLADALNRRDR